MPLSSAKPKLKNSIHKALENAYKSQMDDKSGPDVDKMARKFADAATDELTNAIYDFVKEISINIIHTPTSLVSSTGPVTGVLTIPNNNVTVM